MEPHPNIPFIYQEGGRESPDMGLQVPAGDRASDAALPG